MIFMFLINHLLACEFEFVYKQDMEKLQFDIPQSQFTVFGIWTRYYAFYLDISIQKEQVYYRGFVYEYSIIEGTFIDGSGLTYTLVKTDNVLYFLLIIDDYYFSLYPQQFEGEWMFTYIEIDSQNGGVYIILNTKTDQFEKLQKKLEVKQIKSIKLFDIGDPFSGKVSFTYSQNQQVRFNEGEQLLNYLKTCNMENSCTLNSRYQILSGIMNKFNGPYKFQMQNNYWIDGWFKFTPDSQIINYNNLILQIVQWDKELLKYNGIIPLKISLNFDKINFTNNGIIVETSSYKNAIWDDSDLNPIRVNIFKESYLQLLQNWVYFRFLQYQQSDHNAEFYLSFSDSSYVNKNMSQLNLFKYGYFYIYLGESKTNPTSFLGQLANFNIQSCLQAYPLAEQICHSRCLTCMGPFENNCLSCADQFQSNRVLNQNTITCDCKAGFILDYQKVQCMEIQNYIKSAILEQLQIQQDYIQPCQDGQFQYQIESQIKCYDCPQQSSSGILCADCLENLFTWQKYMKCSYDYFQEDRKNDNIYIKQQRPEKQIEFYYIQDDQLKICLGCILDEGSYLIVKGTTNLYGKCHQNYYYQDQQCNPCQQNCEICEDFTGTCQTFQLTSCPDYCVKCSQQTNNFLCAECQDGFTPSEGICYRCGTNCRLCDYDQNLNRSRCRVCKYSGYFLPFDGFDCVQNTIKNCLIQYQQAIQFVQNISDQYEPIKYNIKTTLGNEQIQSSRIVGEKIIANSCALCEKNYMNIANYMQGDTYCQYNQNLKSDEQVIVKHNYGWCCITTYEEWCWEEGVDECEEYIKQQTCSIKYFENDDRQCKLEVDSTELIQLLQYSNSQFSSCSIGFCTQCIKVQSNLKCIKCSQGYYEEILSGLCIFCPSQLNCQTCQQQNSKLKDGWKWSIRAFSNYQFQTDLVSSNNASDYEVICLTCLKGYMLYNDKCILNCPNNCNRCTIINGENVCTFCGSNNNAKLLTIYNNQCINCPSNCEFCRERSYTDVYNINSLFNPDNPAKYYYSYICLKQKIDSSISYNQVLQQYIKCEDGKFCINQIYIKLKAHCDLDYFSMQQNQQTTREDFIYENILVDSNMPFSNIETPQFFEYLNGIQVESLVYELTLISPSNNCIISNIITTHAPKNVFSLTKTKLIINAKYLTINSLSGQIQNFIEVEIKSCKLNSPFYMKLYHPNQLIIRFQDISFISKQINDIQIIMMNPQMIEVNNFFIYSLQQQNNSQNNMLSYEYTNTSNVKQLSIMMDNLCLVNGSFHNADFLNLKADSKILNVVINMTNSVIESKFYNSSFIKEQSLTNYGQIYLKNVTFMVQVDQAQLINLNGQLNLSSQVKLMGNFTSSNFIRTNQLNITNSQIYNTSLQNSTLIDNRVLKQDNQIYVHEIYNLELKWMKIDISSNLIILVDKNIQDSLIINNIKIIDCSFINKKQAKSQQRLLIFQGANFKIHNSHFQKNILGFTDIQIKNCQSVIIDNVTVVGMNVQGLHQKLDCYQEFTKFFSQNGFIEMENIQSIKVLNSQFSNIMIQDQPIIRIFCFDNSISQQIQIINSNFNNNLILKTESSSQNALLQLLSLGSGNFYAMNVSFTQNILNEYQQTHFSNSATTLLIEAEQFSITLNNTIFNKNQIYNSSDSILYIEAKIIIIQNSIFTQSNLYDDFILPFVIWGSELNNFYQESFSEIFPISSEGGNGKLIAYQLFISFCQFANSTAQQGSGFYLTLQNELSIYDTTFFNLKNKMDKDESFGGSIFVNLIALNSTIQIINSKFINTSSFYDGGAIYINSRYTASNISLQQISVQNCYSFKGAFLSANQNKYSILKISNINIKNNLEGFMDFLSQFQELNDNLVEQFHLSSAIFYVQYGSFFISNSIISNIQLSGVLYFYSASQLSIYDLVIQNNQFSSLGLIQIYPLSNVNTVTYIKNVKILNCINTQPQQIFCQVDLISFKINLQCQNYENNKPQNLISNPQDLQKKTECFFNKLLYFNSSSSIIYFGMIQIANYLYISDLEMRNNNCSLCKDGMITIKNVGINTPEFNNILLREIKLENNICGSGCLVISQQQDINFLKRRLLQNLLYQARFSIPQTVRLESSEFFNNSAKNGILIVSNLSLSIIDAVFIKNVGFDISGGILFLGNQDHTFQIMTSEFSDNTGNKGGAFNLGNKTISSTELLQILLSSNQAKSYGQDLVSLAQGLTISLDGGKIFQQTKYVQKTPKIIDEIIIKPYRILGNNTLQQFLRLPSGYKLKNYQYYDEESKSFIPYNLSLRLIALNSLKQQIQNLQNSFCTIQKRKFNINTNNDGPFEEFFQKIEFNNTSQDYNLDELVINFDPYQSYDYVLQLKFNCSSISIPIINNSSPYNIIDYQDNYELKMNIRTFQCQRGEFYNEKQGTCNLCDSSQSYYSVIIKASRCSLQDEITMKNVTSTLIELREKYWRPYDDNDFVTQCYNFPVNCKGGWSAGDESCEKGHIGALCEQCDLYNTRGSGSYATSGQFQCGSCSNIQLNTLQIFLIIIWTLISIFLSVKGTVENVDEYIIRMKGIKAGFMCVYYERVQIAVLMKILTNYLQIISSIGTFQLKLPPGLHSMFTYSGNPIKSAMNSLDCFLIELSDISILYFRNIWFIFMPIYYSTFIFLIYFFLIKIKYMDFKITVLSTTLIFIFIYVQPDIIGSFISLISYRKISEVFWVQGNVSYLYLTPMHTKWLLSFVLPILLLFGILIPIILYIKMSKYKDRLNDTYVIRLYGYLYNEYSNKAYYWEIIKIYQKELIIIFLIFYEDIIIIKATIIFIIIFCYDLFSKKFKPYKRVDLNKLDSQSSFVCGFSIVLVMAIYFANYNGNQEIFWPFFVLMGIFNLNFILKLITLLLIGYFDKLADKIDQIRDYINDKYPMIIQNYPQYKKFLENYKVRQKRVQQRYLKLREYLWKIVEKNRINQKLDTDCNQLNEKKESNINSKNQEFEIVANRFIQLQKQTEKFQINTLSPNYEINKEKIDRSLEIQNQNGEQLEKSEKIEDQDENLVNKSHESIPLEIESIKQLDFQHKDQDIENNNDEEQQLSLSFQQ